MAGKRYKRTMSNDLASRQPFRSFNLTAYCVWRASFTVAETLDGVYRTLDFWSELFTQRRKVQSKNRKGLSEFFLCVFLCCFAPLREKNFVDSHYFFCYVAPNSKQQKERRSRQHCSAAWPCFRAFGWCCGIACVIRWCGWSLCFPVPRRFCFE